ncbi:MAG: helix-turn-helix domain-containing protein [Burkholderiaceae bacterium]
MLTHAWLTDIGMGSVRERLARLLLRFPTEADETTPLCTRRELGLLLGDVALETISRQMTALRAEGVLDFIDARGRQVRIDRDKLAAVANLGKPRTAASTHPPARRSGSGTSCRAGSGVTMNCQDRVHLLSLPKVIILDNMRHDLGNHVL